MPGKERAFSRTRAFTWPVLRVKVIAEAARLRPAPWLATVEQAPPIPKIAAILRREAQAAYLRAVPPIR